MDLQSLAFAFSDAPIHDAILIVACKHDLEAYKCLWGPVCSTMGTIHNLLLAIPHQPYHLWTSSHLHSHFLMHLYTMQYSLWLVSTIWRHTNVYGGRFVAPWAPSIIFFWPYLIN